MFWKKMVDKTQYSKIILGMIMLQDEISFDLESLLKDYNNNYDDKIQETTGDNFSLILTIGKESVAIGYVQAPIPFSEIEETAQYAYNWHTALEDEKEHKSHLIVSIMQGGQDQIKRFKIFTNVLCSLLRTTNSIGIYKGNQSLLISKEDYLNEAESMTDEHLPLNLWIYFGLRVANNGNSGYTYGLKEFNKSEMEVLNSSKNLEEIRTFLLNIVHYVLVCDVTFQDGQTCGSSKEEKIAISFSKGQFVEDDTFKLAY